jgi:hypothetical protein
MSSKKTFLAVLFFVGFYVWAQKANAFDMTGGQVWRDRVGPGLSFSLGINGCAREYCDDVWDTGASIGATVGFLYRIIPNLVVFVDIHTGHIPTDFDSGDSALDVDHDNGFAFQVTGGAEFHLPITGWLAPYGGFGMGFAYLGVWGEYDLPDNPEFHSSLRGLDFQMRFGADFFPFSRVPNLSMGPALFLGLPFWITMCSESDNSDEECDEPDDMVGNIYDDDLPFIVYFGVMGKYMF